MTLGVIIAVTNSSVMSSMPTSGLISADDPVVTKSMFYVIIFFPVLITVLSLIQWGLDRRKHARMEAKKRRAASADWRGGW